MRINCNFVTTVESTNDDRCLIHNLHAVDKHWGCEKVIKMFSNK